jgi:hypothetical protein
MFAVMNLFSEIERKDDNKAFPMDGALVVTSAAVSHKP